MLRTNINIKGKINKELHILFKDGYEKIQNINLAGKPKKLIIFLLDSHESRKGRAIMENKTIC